MRSSVLSTHRLRLLTIILLIIAIFGLMVWYGTLTPNPAMNHYPENDDVGPDPDQFVDQHVAISGTVVTTDPVTIELEYYPDGTTTITIENANAALLNRDGPIETGHRLSAFGQLTDPATLDAERTIVRAPWQGWYMYAVSFLGGLWVVGRFFQGWRFDRERLAFVARDSPVSLRELTRRIVTASRQSGGEHRG